MNFLEEMDQLSDDDYMDFRNRSTSLNLDGKRYHNPGVTVDFQGIETVDVSNDGSFDQSSQDVNDQFTDGNMSSNVTYLSNNLSKPLISTSILSDRGRSVFKFLNFNRMQSEAFSHLYEHDYNCVISSPTGSGKTVLFELAILRLLNTHKSIPNLKILYIAPTKALCLEREKDWVSKFSSFGLTVGVLTSDTNFLETDKVKKANIIITTPEKWDLMTRKWTDYTKLFEMVKIFFIDEIHILKEKRGSTLEVVVTRMKKICQHVRIIALSATVPNIQDVSCWIKLDSNSPMKASTLVFGEDYRPVKLEKVVYGFKQNANDFAFDSFLNSKLIEVLSKHSNNKPVMIFCPTRGSTVSTSKFLLNNFSQAMGPTPFNQGIRDKDLSELVKNGIAYHHAGISMEDRNLIESGFKNGLIKILCSTSTLAVGVNLPAYLVIIKGTKMWNNISFDEYSELDILQMMGRAGRPQYETEGKAVIMTTSDKQQYYEALVKGNKKLESQLHLNLYENLTAEIYLSTITSLEDALTWLKHTFFYSRYSSNPTAYDEIPYIPNTDMDGRLLNYCESRLRELIDFNIIEICDGVYRSTAYGDAMTKHYIAFDTMKMIIKCSVRQSIPEVLELISNAKEFENIRLKRTEKKLFKIVNNSPILKYPIKLGQKTESIKSSNEKIYLLMQYELGGLEYPNDPELVKIQHSFKQDKFFVFKHVQRLLKCLIDCFIEKKDFSTLQSCLYLYRSVNSSGWEDCSVCLRQLSGVGLAYIRKLANHNVYSFQQIRESESSKLEYYLGMKPGQGNKLKSQVELLPNLSISSEFLKYSRSHSSGDIVIKVKVSIDVKSNGNKWNNKNMVINIASGLSTGELINFRRSHISKIPGARSFILDVPVTYRESVFQSFISCENIGGIGDRTELNLYEFIPDTVSSELKHFSTSKDLYGEDCHDDSDAELDGLLIEASTKDTQCKLASDTSRIILQGGNLQCKHSCKDKTQCRHLCCREGLPPPKPKRNVKEQNSMNTKGRCLKESRDKSQSTSKDITGIVLLKKLHTNNSMDSSADVVRFEKHQAERNKIKTMERSRAENAKVIDSTSSEDESCSKESCEHSTEGGSSDEEFNLDILKMLGVNKKRSLDEIGIGPDTNKKQTTIASSSLKQFEYKPSQASTSEASANVRITVYKPPSPITISSETETPFMDYKEEFANNTTTSVNIAIYENIEEQNHEIQIEKYREGPDPASVTSKYEFRLNDSQLSENTSNQNDEHLEEIFGSDVEIV